MPKSKFPQELDTSVEIPPVRDNITELGSDVINSLRSAIFRIEATLGINPQGATGSSVSSRLSRSMDDNGNILQDALDRSNVLSGPIIDANVSRVASIRESKLKLDYPTTLLQDEISIINSSLGLIQSSLEELSISLAIHTEPTALNRHSATSITLSQSSVIESDLATLSLAAGSLQTIMEDIYNSHINYTGASISNLNNSHSADQIYYDTTNTSNVIFSSDLQGAVDNLANIETVGFKNTILNIASNGRIRTGSMTDGYEGNSLGTVLIDLASATYIQSNGATTTVFSLSTGQTSLETISEFDILTMSGSTSVNDNKEYQISEVSIDGFGLVQEITVYGGPLGLPESGLIIRVTKNIYDTYNSGGFSSVTRPRADKTNTPDVQILNPDSATIISTGIIPTNITALSGSFDITIDGGIAVTIDTYDLSATVQTIDSIVQAINDQSVDQHLNFAAFKVRTNQCYELAIAHNMPNFAGDITNRTILISAGSSNDGTSQLGFSSVLDIETEGKTGNGLNLNGDVFSGFGLIKSFDNSTIEIVTGTLTLSLFSNTLSELGIRVGDIAIVTGSTDSSDDGSYRVGSISGGITDLDLAGTQFAGEMDDDSAIYFLRATANIGELTFEEIASVDGTILFDTFMSEDKDIFHTKRLEIENSLRSGPFFGAVSDISRNFVTSGQIAVLDIDTLGFAILTDPDLQAGAPVFVGNTGTYKLFGSDGLSFITLDVNATGAPLLAQSVTLYGFDEISQNNYHLSRGGFSTSLGRILGSSSDPGIPTLLDRRRSGTADATIVGESFIERFIQGPRNELRTNGIIKGCLVFNPTYTDTGLEIYQNFDVGGGIVFVNGIRFEFPGAEGVRIDASGEYYVAIDNRGCLVAKSIIDNPDNPGENISPFFEEEVATLSEVTNDTTTAIETDLRLFVDNLDLKVIGDIKVANDSRHGHFTDLNSAVAYSKRFVKIFPDMKSPSILIENGVYEVNSTVLIDFDISISGSGPGTILTKAGSLATGSALSGSGVDMGTALFMIGGGSDTNSSNIEYGVSLSNFTYKTDSSLLTNVGCVIALTQPLFKGVGDVSRNASYKIKDITFDGPSTIDGTVADPSKIGEYAIFIGQQDSGTLVPESNLEMGNLILTGCRFNRMGLEIGAVKFTESATSTMKDVIVTNNIVTNASPNLGSLAAIIIEYPTTPAVENFVEASNSVRTGS